MTHSFGPCDLTEFGVICEEVTDASEEFAQWRIAAPAARRG